MASFQAPFDKRLDRIVRTHSRMQNGVSHKVRHDGLIVARPRIYNPKFPLAGVALLLATAFLFKGYVLVALGQGVYDEKVALLSQGSVIERVGAWVMQSDPATVFVAQRMAELGL